MRITVEMIKRKYDISPVIRPVICLETIFKPPGFVNFVTYLLVNDYGERTVWDSSVISKKVSGDIFYKSLFQSYYYYFTGNLKR
jgi:hypothetical protein